MGYNEVDKNLKKNDQYIDAVSKCRKIVSYEGERQFSHSVEEVTFFKYRDFTLFFIGSVIGTVLR